LDDFVKVELLVLLNKRLTRRRIRRGTKTPMCNFREEEEYESAQVREEGNACSNPKDPSEVSGILGIMKVSSRL
jgi:hypothetical protein